MINESMLAYQYEENDIEKYKNIILYEQKKDIFNEEIYEAVRCIINDADCDKKCKKKLNILKNHMIKKIIWQIYRL